MGAIIAIGGGNMKKAELHTIKLSGKKDPNVLMIPTANFDENLDRGAAEYYFNNGCNIDVLYLTHAGVTEEIIKEKIEKADIIYCTGGNLRFLSETWRRTKTDVYLKKAYEDGKILAGVSSGAMCWFAEGWDDCGPEHDFIFCECLGLLPYCMCPHFDSESWSHFADEIKTRSISGIACDNDVALCFADGKRYVINEYDDENSSYFFDKNNGFAKTDLKKHPGIAAML